MQHNTAGPQKQRLASGIMIEGAPGAGDRRTASPSGPPGRGRR